MQPALRSPAGRHRALAVAVLFTVVGVLAIAAALFLWRFGSRADRGLAIPVGGGGFAVLCFGNGISAFWRAANREQ